MTVESLRLYQAGINEHESLVLKLKSLKRTKYSLFAGIRILSLNTHSPPSTSRQEESLKCLNYLHFSWLIHRVRSLITFSASVGGVICKEITPKSQQQLSLVSL